MKKVQTVVVLAAIALALCACGKSYRNKAYFRKCYRERNTVGDNYRIVNHREK